MLRTLDPVLLQVNIDAVKKNEVSSYMSNDFYDGDIPYFETHKRNILSDVESLFRPYLWLPLTQPPDSPLRTVTLVKRGAILNRWFLFVVLRLNAISIILLSHLSSVM